MYILVKRPKDSVRGTQNRAEIANFMFSVLAVFVKLSRYVNIRTQMSSSLLIIQHYMFRPDWPSLSV
jgi:hypothetical protein